MNVLIASNPYKSSLTSALACQAICAGLRKSSLKADLVTCPISDGGHGICETLLVHNLAKKVELTTIGAYGELVNTYFLYNESNKTAYIECALAIGIHYYKKNQLNPLLASSYGVGAMILKASELGAKKVYVGVGDTATNDGGMGLLEALGIEFYDKSKHKLAGNGQSLQLVDSLNMNNYKLLNDMQVILASDVNNTLYGEQGAAYVYGPQKGADEEMIKYLDDGLRNYAKVLANAFGKDLSCKEGSGCGGGIGFALQLFMNASSESGFDIVSNLIGLEDKVSKADIVFTGEGHIDSQTLCGKGSYGIAQLAKKHQAMVYAFCGRTDRTINFPAFDSIYSLAEYRNEIDDEKLIANNYEDLVSLACYIGNTIKNSL